LFHCYAFTQYQMRCQEAYGTKDYMDALSKRSIVNMIP
jgi:hypothetical protein